MLFELTTATVHASANCDNEFRITHKFDNGASWDLCWESRIRENLVLRDIHFTPPNGKALRVLSSARLSQLHVAYDDSDVTYNDVTQYGLGGAYLLPLTEADCPNGKLHAIQTRNALCVWLNESDGGYRTATRARQAQSLHLFSVSQIGAYAYITSWAFHDDGAFVPAVGATGALQRSSQDTDLPYGRVLQGDEDTLWLSHTHNYYWRLDFDLGRSAYDDVVSELRYEINQANQRVLVTELFEREQARQIDPKTQQLWRIADSRDEHASGYQLEPTHAGHRFERKQVEPYTEFDFFVTVAKDCERFASQNARFNPDCQNHVLQFVDGQALQGEDIVVWNRVAFHHVPRSEDQRHMHTHWDEFVIRPFNVHSGTNTLSDIPNTAPEFTPLPTLHNKLNDHVHQRISAQDEQQDVLSYTASGLPIGLRMNNNGYIEGNISELGIFDVTVTASDDHSQTSASFDWHVSETLADSSSSNTQHAGTVSWMLLSLLTLLVGNRFQLTASPVSSQPASEQAQLRKLYIPRETLTTSWCRLMNYLWP